MTTGQDIVNYALQFKGTKYVWGGNDLRTGVDCSGLVQQVFKNFGISTARVTNDQIGQGSAVGIKGLRAGDLVFFDTDPGRAGPDHVGIYMGNGKMIEAPKPGKSVQVTDMTSGYWVDRFMGGRRLDGYNSVGGSVNDLDTSPEAEVRMSPEDLAASYGWAYGFLNSNSELKSKFDTAVKENWSPQKFQAEIRDTKWFKSNSETRRQAQVMKKTDPASWAASINAEKIRVQLLAAEVGAAVPPGKLAQIAQNVIETGMDEDMTRQALAQYVTFSKEGTMAGEAGMHVFAMKQYAAQMGVKLSDQALKTQAQMVIRKVATAQDFEDQIRQQAKSMLPAYEEQIDAGSTVKDIADPYMQAMSSELELPYNAIQLDDPAIKRALNGLDANGKPGGVNILDFTSQLRSDPRWKQTSKAREGSMATGAKVLRDMGLLADS